MQSGGRAKKEDDGVGSYRHKRAIKSKDDEIARVKKDLVEAQKNRLSGINQIRIPNNKADNAIYVSHHNKADKCHTIITTKVANGML